MKVIKPAKLSITVEANSREAIEKLLEQALFELRHDSKDKNGFERPFTHDSKGEQSGTMGGYRFEYAAPEYDTGFDVF